MMLSNTARLAQSTEHKNLNFVVLGLPPTESLSVRLGITGSKRVLALPRRNQTKPSNSSSSLHDTSCGVLSCSRSKT